MSEILGPIRYPARDLQEWTVTDGLWIGCVHQWGKGRFEALDREATLIAGFSKLDGAVKAVKAAHFVRDAYGICAAVIAPY